MTTEPRFCLDCGAPLVWKSAGEIERFVCSKSCGYVFWNNPTPVVAAIVEYQGKVLLARNAAWKEGVFALITGFLEEGEDPDVAVVREVEEELGLGGRIVGFVGNYSFIEANQLLLVYHVRAEGEVCLNEELAEYKLFDHAKLRPWDRGTGPALRDWLQRNGYPAVPFVRN